MSGMTPNQIVQMQIASGQGIDKEAALRARGAVVPTPPPVTPRDPAEDEHGHRGTGGGGPATQAGGPDAQAVIAGGSSTGPGIGTAASAGQAATRAVGSGRHGEFIGIKTAQPDQLISPLATPRSTNWNGIEEPGSISVRRGLMKLADDGQSFDSGNVASWNGISCLPIPPSDESGVGSLLLMWYNDSSDDNFGNTDTARIGTVKTGPGWARPRDLDDVEGLSMTLADGGSGQLNVTTVFTDGVAENSVVERVVRYSTVDYPLDIDGKDETSSSTIVDYASWDGASSLVSQTGLSTGVEIFVTAWAIGREGIARPVKDKITLA